MYRKYFSLLVFTLVIAIQNFAQQLPTPRNIETAYENGTRSKDGKPGKNYWQNAADYMINVNFDPLTRVLNGTVSILYTNNSPNALSEIWFKLYPNLYMKGAIRNMAISK